MIKASQSAAHFLLSVSFIMSGNPDGGIVLLSGQQANSERRWSIFKCIVSIEAGRNCGSVLTH